MTGWWCEYDGEAHERAAECSLYRNGGTGPTGLTPKQVKDYKRRLKMHANHPTKGGCVVIGVALLGFAAAVLIAAAYGAHELLGALIR